MNVSGPVSRRRVMAFGAAGIGLPAAAGVAFGRPATAQGATNTPVLSDVFDVKSFGAKGDGVTIDSGAINNAIEAAAASGGTVYFPAGTYASYSIHLQSNVALYLAQGATILAATPTATEGYDPAEEPGAGNSYQDFGHSHWHNSLIWGESLDNISIEGQGMIWGKGLSRGDRDLTLAAGIGNKSISLKN